MVMPFNLRGPETGEAGLRRELYFLTLFRVLEAGLLAFAVLNPLRLDAFGVRNPAWATVTAIAYLLLSCVLFLLVSSPRWRLRQHVAIGISLDLMVFVAALHNVSGLSNGIVR